MWRRSCGHSALRDYVVERWIDRIVARDLRPIHALDIADRHDIRRLQGYAYYVQLLEMDDNFDITCEEMLLVE